MVNYLCVCVGCDQDEWKDAIFHRLSIDQSQIGRDCYFISHYILSYRWNKDDDITPNQYFIPPLIPNMPTLYAHSVPTV